MLSVNYSLNCVTFDPKGKILQVIILSSFIITINRLSMLKKLSNKDQPLLV